MKDFDITWVDMTLPNSQPRRHNIIRGVNTKAEAMKQFNTRTSSEPSLCASTTDKIISITELVKAQPADLSRLVTTNKFKKLSHYAQR